LTKFNTPENIVPATSANVVSDTEHPTSTAGVAEARPNIQHIIPNNAINVQPNIQSPTTHNAPTNLLKLPQCAEAETVTAETSQSNKSYTRIQDGPGKPPATEIPLEVKVEEQEFKKEGDVSKTETAVKAGEPEIKKEQEDSILEPIMQESVNTNKESQFDVKENQAVIQETRGNTEESQVTMKEKPTTVREAPTAIEENRVAIQKETTTTQEVSRTIEESQINIKKKKMHTEEIRATGTNFELSSVYHNLFLIYYGKAPIIDTNDISVALQQAEALIRIAELYGSIPVVRPYLGYCLMQFGRDVYAAILRDPPRWFQLSLYLESAPIFKEAVIHIIGNYSYWPWSTVQLSDFPEDIKGPGSLFERKLAELKTLQDGVDRIFLTSAIKIGGEEIPLDPTDKKTINTWLVIQLWRDWFTRSITKTGLPTPTKCMDGTIYRLIAKGGDAYLPLETVFNTIKALREPNRMLKVDKQEIEEDLKLMKDFAQKEVRLLYVNNSMLAVDEAGIEHLTCTRVENDEIPWLQKDST
jgi:hypothetical protein